MNTPKTSAIRSTSPGPAQRQEAARLSPNRPLLLQTLWAWPDGTEPEAGFARCLEALKALGGMPLTHARCDSRVIGTETVEWDTAAMWALPSQQALMAFMDSESYTQLNAEAYAVRAITGFQPPRAVLRALKVATLIMRFLPAPAANRPIPAASISGGVNPTSEQFERFKADAMDSTIHMFNLLKFRHEAVDAATGKTVRGKRLYTERYASVASQCIFRLGGRVVSMGRYAFTLIGNGGDPATGQWDEIVIAEYPGRSAFLRMLSNDLYQKAVLYREAALERTELIASTPVSA